MTPNSGKMRVMAAQESNTQPSNFKEAVRVPAWMIGMMGLVLGVTAGALTGVAVRNLVGDEPIITGSEATIFYVCFAIAVLVDLFLLFNFTFLMITVGERGLEFRYGLFSKFFSWSQISDARTDDYNWVPFGGWGIRFSTQGRRAWSQVGVKTGVVVGVVEGGNERHYFVTSRREKELESVLRSRISANRSEQGS
jgi:hypothetical protein